MARRFQRTTIIIFGLMAFLAGLMLARVWPPLDIWWMVPGVLLLALTFRRKDVLTLLAVVICGVLLGWWRGGALMSNLTAYQQFYQREAVVTGQVRDDPVYDDQGRLDFRVGNATVNGRRLPGQIRVRSFVNDVRRGDAVEIKGKLVDGFGNYQATMYFGTVAVTSRSKSPIEAVRRQFFAAVYSVLPEPEGSLGLGFLVGLRSALPAAFDEQLRVAGLTHIVVASGYNLTILVRLARRLLARFSKYQATAGSVMLILGFVAITGASPSIVRASVVTLLSLWAWYYGRRFQPLLIILLGAALTAGSNPLYMWHDVGWWLSFLAFAGVLILAPLITARFWRGRRPPLLVQVALETVAAQIMALPLIMFVFGEVSLVSLLANVAVVPLIPLAMATTFIGGLAGLLVPAIAGWLALPARLILQYIVEVTELLAAPAWAQKEITINQVGMLALYAIVCGLTLLLYRKARFSFKEAPSVIE